MKTNKIIRFTLAALICVLTIGHTHAQTGGSWMIKDITPASNSTIQFTDFGGMLGIQVRLTFRDENSAPDSMKVVGVRTGYPGFPNILSVRNSGCSPVEDSGMGGKMRAYYFIIDWGPNRTQYISSTISGSFDVYENGQITGYPFGFNYTISQFTTRIDPGIIGDNQTIVSGTSPARITGSPATCYNGSGSYQWYEDQGNGWVAIPAATGQDYQPGRITTETRYKRAVVDQWASGESNIITVSVRPHPGFELDNRNNIVIYSPLNGLKTRDSLTRSTASIQVTYYDGVSRPSQVIDVGGAVDCRDIITPYEYAIHNRSNDKEFRPYVAPSTSKNGRFDPLYNQNQTTYHASKYRPDQPNPFAYTTNLFESSPSGRLLKSTKPGEKINLLDKSANFGYALNADREVLQFSLSQNNIVLTGWSPKGIFERVTTRDEDQHTIERFTNTNGDLVLERQYLSSDKFADTYYIYDLEHRLACVIPPLGVDNLPVQNGALPQVFLDTYCYVYTYFSNGLPSSKAIPQKRPESYRYNTAGQIIQQSVTDKTSIISEYDEFFRLIKEFTVFIEENPNVGSSPDEPEILGWEQLSSEYRYDAYPNEALAFEPNSICAAFDSRTKGYKTFERLRVVDTPVDQRPSGEDDFVERTFYYDDKGRVVQVVEKDFSGIVSRVSTQYDFIGNVLATLEQRGSDRTTTTYVYDHRSRVLSEHKTLNNASPVDIIYRYDDLGVLVGRNIDGIEEQMTYDIQGALTAKTVCNAEGDELFSTDLHYYTPRHSSTTPSYSGNITEWDWRFGASDTGNTYAFAYDALSRLTTTTQYIDGIHDDRFVEKGLTYDLNSNILGMQRTAEGALSDNLTYTYTGNQLTSLSGTTTANYSYDANGNMTHDGANNLDLTYNYLNLIEKVSNDGSVVANYAYLSDGTKFSSTDVSGDGLLYRGSLVYRKQAGTLSLESAAFGTGRFVATTSSSGTTYRPNYFITDHLGSVRLVVDGDGNILERNDYYPFGLRWDDPTSFRSDNRYGYNAKEWQGFLNVPYNDHGARMLEPRFRLSWGGPDMIADETPDISPFAFCKNNPIRFVDLTGLSAQPAEPEPESSTPIEPVVIVGIRTETTQNRQNPWLDWAIPGWSFAADADAAWRDGRYGLYAMNMLLGTGDILLSVATGGQGTLAKAGAKAIAKKGVKATQKGLTKSLRKNMLREYGITTTTDEAHHKLPIKFRPKFNKIGLNIDDPKNGVWMEPTKHKQKANAYNLKWSNFFETNQSPTKQQILQKSEEFMKEIYK